MKSALLAAALVSMLAVGVASSRGEPEQRGESWRDNESAAFAEARASQRHIVVVFGADWCLPCQKVEQIMNDDRVFVLLSESFVPLHFDITRLSDHDEAMQAKYHAPVLPAVIFVDVRGRELGRWDRENPSTEGFIAKMASILVSHPLASGMRR